MLAAAISISALIFGTLGPDTLAGTAGADDIRSGPGRAGGGGDDAIRLYGGKDFAKGEDGGDTITGGPGADVIDGGPGDDELAGNAGYDDISGGEGNDRIDGGDGPDVLVGGGGDDWIDGGGGTEYVLSGGDGNDTVIGRTGAGGLNGGRGANILMAPPGGRSPVQFRFETFDGRNGFGRGANSTTIPGFRRGIDEILMQGTYYGDRTPVTNPDTNGDGAISAGDKGWTVLPDANPTLRFQGWNSTLLLPGTVSILPGDMSVQ